MTNLLCGLNLNGEWGPKVSEAKTSCISGLASGSHCHLDVDGK